MSNHDVLIIEDDELLRQTLIQQLHGLGVLEVDEAADVDAARRALEGRTRYSLIFADLMLPDGDAVELLRSSGRQQGGAGLILMSSLGEGLLRSVAVLCRERGLRVLGALPKPIRPDGLRRLMQIGDVAELSPVSAVRAPCVEDIERALDLRQIGALVQPIVRAADGRLEGVEVLAHWESPQLGVVPAAQLARLAEDKGLGGALMKHMIGLALRSCADWRAAGQRVPVAVNVGDRVLRDLLLPELVERMLKSLQLDPELLSIEVGEHVMLDHSDTLDVLSRLRMRGVRIALDNFGRGQASAMRVQRLPVSELKIDRGFLRGLPNRDVARAVVDYAVSLARGLGIQTTAVGVENAEQAQAATAMGCDCLQGYWIGRPIAPTELLSWLQSQTVADSLARAARDADQGFSARIGVGSVQDSASVSA